MKKRNPLFVAAFPLILITLGYIPLVLMDAAGSEFSDSIGIVLFISLGLVFMGSAYTIYWLVVTARALRRETGLSIPNALLLIVPLGNYWWMWRYSQAAEAYVKNKQQAALTFVLIAALGSVGNGIIQDLYNKQLAIPPDPSSPLPTL
jgi:hypothetical protein